MIDFISQLAQQAGDLAAKRRKTLGSSQIHTKNTETDLVTDVDREVENFIISALQKKTPGYGIFGEESGFDRNPSPWCWVIDPIDGTTSFVHDLPFYCVSIGLRYQGRGVLGAVYSPKLGELFLAESGKGTTLNGEKVRVSAISELKQAVVATGFSCVRAKREFDNLKLMPDIVHNTCAFRRSGSAALDLAYVACGRLEAFWELALAPYDIAAGEVLVREAGGTVSDMLDGSDCPARGTLASNGLIHEKMLKFFDIPGGVQFC